MVNSWSYQLGGGSKWMDRIKEQPDLQRQLEEQRAMHAEVSGAVVNVVHVSNLHIFSVLGAMKKQD